MVGVAMPERYTAFISYASPYLEWVETLHRNLERCGETLFLDRVDVGPGRSPVQQRQAGLDAGGRMVLVATPEALASARVMDEWGALIAQHRDWKQNARLQLALLVDTPLPPFLLDLQDVDFRQHTPTLYRERLRELLGGVRGLTSRRLLPALPDGIEVPSPPPLRLPTELRGALVALLEPLMRDPLDRSWLADRAGLEPDALEGFPSTGCAAASAIVQSTGGEAPLEEAARLLNAVQAGPWEKTGAAAARLKAAREALRRATAGAAT
jgi:hypothetical protein